MRDYISIAFCETVSDSVASSCPINSRYEHVDRENKSNFYDLYFMMGKMDPLKSVYIMLTTDSFCCVRSSLLREQQSGGREIDSRC